MGTIIEIPAVNRKKQYPIIFDPEEDLKHLIGEYIGTDARLMYEEIIETYQTCIEELSEEKESEDE